MAEAIASTTSTLPAPAVVELSSDKELDDLLRSGARAVVHCWAPWAAPCAHMNTVLEVLHTQHPTLTLARIQAEQHPTVAARYSIRDVPHILFLAGGRVVRQLTGADAPSLTRSAAWLADATDDALLTAACESLKCSAEIVVIIKGVVSSPRCAFSRQVIEILQARGIVFKSIDILSDGEVRERMKEVAAWETYPMVFARGRFVGGVDAIVGLADEGRLVSELARGEDEDVPSRGADDEGDENTGIKKEFESVDERGDAEKECVSEEERVRRRMEGLSKRGRVMVFMKGNPETPRCGFSRRIVGTLHEHEVEFESFDVLEDNEVRQGMKTFSKWPTFPQVYAEGRFVGGLDVINELVEMGELRGELGLPS